MGRYARIKLQTNVAVTWLIETASEHGSNVQVGGDTNSRASAAATPTSTSIKTGRLKGKARKEAKKKEQLQSQSPAPKIKASKTIYKVSTEEILRQARYLENLDQELVMSKPAWDAFKEAVRGRTEYATKFANKQPDHEGNAGHVYFLDTLRQVVDMIGKVVRVQETSLDNSERRQDTGLTLHNLFGVLRDVELTDDVQGTANLATSPDKGLAYGTAATVPSARYEPAIDSDEESRLRWLCFKDDADSIISWVVNLWKQYFDHSEEDVSLETKSLLSDLALDLLYKIEDGMEHNNDKVKEAMSKELASLSNWSSTVLALHDFRAATYEGLHKYKDFILFDARFIRYLIELQLEMTLRSDLWEQNGPPPPHQRCISNASLDLVSRTIAGATRGSQHSIAASLLDGIWGLHSPNAHEPFHYAARLAEVMYDQSNHCRCDGILYPERAKDKTLEFNALLSWTFEWPGEILRYFDLRAIDSNHPAAALSGFHRDIWKHFDLSMARKEHIIKACASIPDPAGTAEARLQFGEEHVMPSEDPNFLRKNNPLTPAKLALNLQFLRAEIGFDFANDDLSLFLMCHLYNALRQLGYLDVPWEKLDSLIDMHIKTIFLGALPTESAKQMCNRASIAVGCAPELVRAANTGKGRVATIKNMAVLKEKRFGALSFPPSMAIVADHLHDREPLRRTLTRLDAEMVAKHSKENRSSRVKSFLDEENPTAFLDRLRNHVADFPRYLALDCIELTRICGGLLRRLKSDDVKILMKYGGVDEVHQQYVALLILQELDNEEYMTRPGMTVPKVTYAVEAAAILKEYIEGGEDARAAVKDYVQRW
ncbi:uncharacterized protein J4E92_000939 [Alternaria infectoria]|uniref:uncharacterized protein n=1 Tax=Alternaria infectoria TaxID=45303 RepID=UPI00221F5421|nr:uncharacterized protein J4E92_000939 [Alternaria infectoria]KAI4939653.1 hypothetical protein J4E92_000939 [Alternaria infectoria]